MKRFAIGGTGRSGTKWCATVLRNAGIYCGHEQVFATAMLPYNDQPHWSDFEGDSSLAAVPYFPRLGHDVTKILVVRHPDAFISSMLKVGGFIRGSQPAGLNTFIDSRWPTVRGAASEAEAAALFWLYWNQWGALNADVVLRLEELNVSRLLTTIGTTPRWHTFPLGPVNAAASRADTLWSKSEICAPSRDRIYGLAKEFGYDT